MALHPMECNPAQTLVLVNARTLSRLIRRMEGQLVPRKPGQRPAGTWRETKRRHSVVVDHKQTQCLPQPYCFHWDSLPLVDKTEDSAGRARAMLRKDFPDSQLPCRRLKILVKGSLLGSSHSERCSKA